MSDFINKDRPDGVPEPVLMPETGVPAPENTGIIEDEVRGEIKQLKILVVDDKRYNRISAIMALGDQDLTIADTAAGALEHLQGKRPLDIWRADSQRGDQREIHISFADYQKEIYAQNQRKKPSFDAVLTDLYMPVGSFRGGMNSEKDPPPENLEPLGLIVALSAMNQGIPTVIVTDINYHHNWIVALLSNVSYRYESEGARNRLWHISCSCNYRGVRWDENMNEVVMHHDFFDTSPYRREMKDWRSAMKHSKFFPELAP